MKKSRAAYIIPVIMMLITLILSYMSVLSSGMNWLSGFRHTFSYSGLLTGIEENVSWPWPAGQAITIVPQLVGYIAYLRWPSVIKFIMPTLYSLCCWCLYLNAAVGGQFGLYMSFKEFPPLYHTSPWWVKALYQMSFTSLEHQF